MGAGVGLAKAVADAVLRLGQSRTLVSPSLRDAPQRLPEGVQCDYPGACQPTFKEVLNKVQGFPAAYRHHGFENYNGSQYFCAAHVSSRTPPDPHTKDMYSA